MNVATLHVSIDQYAMKLFRLEVLNFDDVSITRSYVLIPKENWYQIPIGDQKIPNLERLLRTARLDPR